VQIDTRLPAIQTGKSVEARDGQTSAPPPAAPVGNGSDSDFYISPILRFDSRSLTVIFQVRDSGSGDVVRQFPPETVVERYRQDPTAKPFVLSPRSASGKDDPDPADEALAPFPKPEEAPGGAEAPGATVPTASARPADPVAGDPVDVVA